MCDRSRDLSSVVILRLLAHNRKLLVCFANKRILIRHVPQDTAIVKKFFVLQIPNYLSFEIA